MSDIEDTTNLLTNSATTAPKECLKTVVKTNNCKISKTKFAPAVTVTFLAGISFGYDIGIWNYYIPHFNDYCRRQHIATFVWLVGALVSSFFGGWLLNVIDQYGRKKTMLLSLIAIMIGSVIPLINQSFGILLFGRFVSGMGGAMSVVVHSIYACETSEDNLRGFRVNLQQVGIAIGMLISAGLGTADIPWQYVTWAAFVPALLGVVLIATCIPESPHYELVKMSRMTQNKRPTSCEAIVTVTETILMGIILVISHRITARTEVFHISKGLIINMGICASSASNLAVILFLTIKMCGAALCAASVDRIGRRILLMLGSACMLISVFALGTFSILEESIYGHPNMIYNSTCFETGLEDVPQDENKIMFAVGPGVTPDILPTGVPPPYPFLPTPLSLTSSKEDDCDRVASPVSIELEFMVLVISLIFELAYSSIEPIIWLLLVEMFPAAVRGRSTSICSFFYWAIDYIHPAVASRMILYMSTGGVLLLYSSLRFLYIIFIFLFLVETRSKTLHQIAQEIKNISPKIRMFQNLQWLPCFRKNEWLHRQSRCYREASHPIAECTVI